MVDVPIRIRDKRRTSMSAPVPIDPLQTKWSSGGQG